MASSSGKSKEGSGQAASGTTGVTAGTLFAGCYEIVRLLGEGGMGSVYLARDIRSGGREVALKILHSANLRPGLTLRDGMTLGSLGGQSAEARFLASCEHASILPVYDAGTDPTTGMTFFTMRACLLSRDEMERLCDDVFQCPYPFTRQLWDDGPSALTLRDLLRGNRALPEKCVARIGIDIVEALSYVHSRVPPLLHRDIKPSNILFEASGRAILSDFGIANEIFAEKTQPTGPVPAPGAGEVRRGFSGTPAYAAPEQRAGACSPASDYYSLGIVLHEALTGMRIVGSTRPSRFDPSGISRPWDDLLSRLLDPDPAKRLSDSERILRALRAIVNRGRNRRRVRLWAAAVCAAVAVIAGFGIRISEAANGASDPDDAETTNPADPDAIPRRAAEVDRQVKLLNNSPIWPSPTEPWFPAVLMPARPENNRRHLDGAVFEMLLPGGVPMQFAAMTIDQHHRYIRYSHGYFRDAAGRPNMTADERKANDTVVSKRLLVSRTEVTREQFDAVMSATGPVPLQTLSCADWATNAPAAMARLGMGPKEFYSRLRNIGQLIGKPGNPDLAEVSMQAVFMRVSILKPPPPGMPAAEGLRFADVERFVDKLNSLCPEGCEFRLPTEAEWEAACRMKSDLHFEGVDPDSVCWSRENSGGAPHEVALRNPSAFGLFDMHGNVAEWCLDGFRPLVRPAFDPVVPVASDGLRVVKGGSWADPVEECGSEARRAAGPDDTGIGFRLVLEY